MRFASLQAKNGQPISGTAANFKQQRMENDFCERDYTLNLLAYFKRHLFATLFPVGFRTKVSTLFSFPRLGILL